MASGFGTFRSSNYYYSTANGWMYNTAIVSQSVNTTARTVTITVRSLLTYYRAGGGTWTPAWGADISYDSGSSNYIKATVDGQTATSGTSIGLLGAGAALYQGNYYNLATGGVSAYGQADITKSVTFNYPNSGAAFTKSWSSSINYRGTVMTVSGTVTTDSIAVQNVAPSGWHVSIDSVESNSADITATIDSFGYPDAAAKRYVEIRVYSGTDYRYVREEGTNTITATVDNNSAVSGSLILVGNTKYQAAAYAHNTALGIESSKYEFITKPAEIDDVTYTVASNGVVTFTTVVGQEGTAETVTEQYSTDGNNWFNMTGGKVQLAKSEPVTGEKIYFRRSNSSGTTSVYTLTYDVPATAPTVTVKVNSVNSTNISLTGTVSSYGFPNNKTGRYLQLQVIYGFAYKYVAFSNSSTGTAVVSNTSEHAGNAFTIIGNKRYSCAAYANNTYMSAFSDQISVLTQPGLITRVYTENDGLNNITATVTHEEEGNDDTVRTEYSLNGGTTWLTSATGDTFTFKITADTQVRVRRTNSSGSTTVYNTTAKYVEPVKTYLPVDGKAKKAQKIYMPVSGVTKLMRKVYMGDENGFARLTYINTSVSGSMPPSGRNDDEIDIGDDDVDL